MTSGEFPTHFSLAPQASRLAACAPGEEVDFFLKEQCSFTNFYCWFTFENNFRWGKTKVIGESHRPKNWVFACQSIGRSDKFRHFGWRLMSNSYWFTMKATNLICWSLDKYSFIIKLAEKTKMLFICQQYKTAIFIPEQTVLPKAVVWINLQTWLEQKSKSSDRKTIRIWVSARSLCRKANSVS